jgi:hypothetical protein
MIMFVVKTMRDDCRQCSAAAWHQGSVLGLARVTGCGGRDSLVRRFDSEPAGGDDDREAATAAVAGPFRCD